MRRTVVLVLPALLLLMFAGLASSGAEMLPDCDKCGNTGRVLDGKAKEMAKWFDKGYLPVADSEYKRFPDSMGTGYKPCTNCPRGKKWQEELNARKDRCEALITERAEKMKLMFGDKPPRKQTYHAKSQHFIITFNCKDRNGLGMKCDSITVGWMLLSHMENTYNLFMKFIAREENEEIKFWEDQPRCFYLWSDRDEQIRAAQALGGVFNEVSFVFRPFYCSMVENEFAEHTDHYIVHHSMQLLLDGMEPSEPRSIPEWLINGIGNWAEWQLFEECNIAAIGEGMRRDEISIPFLGWPSIITKMIKSKQIKPFAEYANCNIKELTSELRVQSFGIIDYLYVFYGGKKMRQFLTRLKETKDQFKTLREVYELTPEMLDDKWQEWALEDYKKYKSRK
jgi:hypothetical protein